MPPLLITAMLAGLNGLPDINVDGFEIRPHNSRNISYFVYYFGPVAQLVRAVCLTSITLSARVASTENVTTCIFQMKPATDSIASLPPIPREKLHPFQSKSATL